MIPVLYEDDEFLVCDKPARLLTIATEKETKRHLVVLANQQFHQKNPHLTVHLHPCHRLDRDTSGCLLLAKGKKNQKLGMQLFHERRIRKTYIAVVQGKVRKKAGTIQQNILAPSRQLGQSRVKKAQTEYKVIKSAEQYTVLEVEPITGRTNQIRIHLAQMGHPIVGERKFAFARDFELKWKRTALHAHKLAFQHPLREESIQVVSTVPKDMEVFCE